MAKLVKKYMRGDAIFGVVAHIFKVTRLIRLTRKKKIFFKFFLFYYVSCRINAIRLLAVKRLMLLSFIRVLEPG